MDDREIISKVKECVAESLAIDVDRVQTESTLRVDLGADSLDFMDIIFNLEDSFNIRLEKEDFKFTTKFGIKEGEGIEDNYLTMESKVKLKTWLESLPIDQEIHTSEVWNYISVNTYVKLIKELLNSQT